MTVSNVYQRSRTMTPCGLAGTIAEQDSATLQPAVAWAIVAAEHDAESVELRAARLVQLPLYAVVYYHLGILLAAWGCASSGNVHGASHLSSWEQRVLPSVPK